MSAPGRLRPFDDFGLNPGALTAKSYVPDTLSPRSALVVVLHGCTQDADGYDHRSGWSELADRHGFALLYPEQPRSNNPAGCFNWFAAQDISRGSGEAMSIHQMIESAIERHEIDPRRVFVTGLSAGGAMAVAMLAAYPELFAGGAIIAGLPYATATSVPEALDRMRGHRLPAAPALEASVRGASDFTGPWPTLSVWQGDADRTVDAVNAEAILAQWRGVHGLSETPHVSEAIDGATRRAWRDEAGREVIEAWSIAGMGHGTPIDAGPDGVGTAGPYMLDVGLSSTQHIAAHWGLIPPQPLVARRRAARQPAAAPRRQPPAAAALPTAADGVGKVIEDAL
ncbi:MAG: PHB depolymerase family esterase, partial [Sphingomonadaceae bacterium]|nr:PHB depolymerase family esterase [Sphingomonadaceae bacterium]